MPDKYNNFLCPVCNQKRSFSKVFDIANKRKEIKIKNFTYYKCIVCSFWLLKPDLKKKDLKNIYTETYYPDLEKPHRNKFIDALFHFRLYPAYESFVSEYPGRKLLDVGSGTGEFLRKMKKRGFSVYGLDPYKPAVVLSRKKIGNNRVFLGTVNKLLSVSESFEAITLWHVLEHMDSPFQDIQILRKKLQKKGKIFIEVPSADAFSMQIFRKYYGWHMIPEHNHYFTKKSLVTLFTSVGYTIIEVYSPPRALSNFSYSLRNVLLTKRLSSAFVTTIFIASLPFSALLTCFASLFDQGEVLRLVAER